MTVTEQKAIMKDLSFISNFVLIIIKILKIGLPVLISKNVLKSLTIKWYKHLY